MNWRYDRGNNNNNNKKSGILEGEICAFSAPFLIWQGG